MADQALEKALAWRDELTRTIKVFQDQAAAIEEEIERRQRALERAERFVAEWHQFANTDLPKSAEMSNGVPEAPPAPLSPPPAPRQPEESALRKRKATNNSKKEEVAKQARELILDRGEPIMRSELYRLLTEERGLTIEGTEPEMVLSTMLWRMAVPAKIVRLKSGGYWLAEKPYEPAGYWPEMEHLMGATDPSPPGELVAEHENEEPGH